MATKALNITEVPAWWVTPLAKAIYVAVAAGLTAWGGYTAAKEPVVTPVVAPQAPAPATAPLPPVAPAAVLQERLDTQAAATVRIEQKVDRVSDDVNSIKVSLARLQGQTVGEVIVPLAGTTGQTLVNARTR